MSILMVVSYHWKDIAFVFWYLNTNNVPPSLLQPNTSKKVSIGCSLQRPEHCVFIVITTLVYFTAWWKVHFTALNSAVFMRRRPLKCWSFRSQEGLKTFMLAALRGLISVHRVSSETHILRNLCSSLCYFVSTWNSAYDNIGLLYVIFNCFASVNPHEATCSDLSSVYSPRYYFFSSNLVTRKYCG